MEEPHFLNQMKINPVTVVVSINNNIVLDTVKLDEKDKCRIISVISGG